MGLKRDPLITWVTFRFGVRYGRCSRAVARGIEIRVLDGVSTRSFAGFGCESLCRDPLHLDSRWVFHGGTGEEEKTPGYGQEGRSLDDECFQTDPFCYILVIYNKS